MNSPEYITYCVTNQPSPNIKKIKIIPCIFSDRNTMKLEVNHKKKLGKIRNTWRLKNTLLKKDWDNQEIKKGIKKYIEGNENENTAFQNLWDGGKAVLRGKHVAIQGYSRSKENLKLVGKLHIALHIKELEKEQQILPKCSTRRETVKIREEINDIETKSQ